MKGFFTHLFAVSILTISLSGIAHADTTFSLNSNVGGALQNAINFVGYTEDHVREVCTSGIKAGNSNSDCQRDIFNCEATYKLNAENDPFDCRAQPINGFFICSVSPTKDFDNQIRSQFNADLTDHCGIDFSGLVGGRPFNPGPIVFPVSGGNAGTPTPDPAADPVTTPPTTNPDPSSNSDAVANPTAAAPTAGGNATGSASGCSLSPLQGGAPMGDLSLLSTLALIPLALRMRKKNQD